MKLTRRRFLRGVQTGVGVSVGLPVLDAWLNNNGNAFAEGQALPKRFGIFFWGNGTRPERWVPTGTGANYQLSEELAPLEPFKADIAPVTNLKILGDQFPHHSGMCAILSGAQWKSLGPVRDTMKGTFDAPTLDQVVATAWAGKTPFRSLELGVLPISYVQDEGTTFNSLSHNGPSSMNPPDFSPVSVFQRIFATKVSEQSVVNARLSVLDAVKGDIAKMRQKVGARDKSRLDAHFESVRSIEQRLQSVAKACAAPQRPVDVADAFNAQNVTERNRLMADVLAHALACDLTRSFSYLFSYAGCPTIFTGASATAGHHSLSHNEAKPQPTIHAVTVFIMQRFHDLLVALKGKTEGAGTLLDNCAVLATSEHADGNIHSNIEFPVLVAGRASGKLKVGQHYRSPTNENATNLLLTMLRALDFDTVSFGAGQMATQTAIGALLG
jgi:hypothetical protein